MAITARVSQSTGDYEKIKPGTYPAVCVGVWDLGLQKTVWQGQEKQQYKLLIAWMLGEKNSKGESFFITKKYTNSLSEKAYLRKDLSGWFGKDMSKDEAGSYDLEDLIGKQCILSIKQSDDGRYTNVNSVSAPMNGVSVKNDEEIPLWIKAQVNKARESAIQEVPQQLKQFTQPEETVEGVPW